MPRPKSPLRAALDELRTTGLALISHESWVAACCMTPSDLRRRSAPLTARVLRHRDVVVLRLVELQPTVVHRDLWPYLLTVGISGARWQMDWMSPQETRLLALVDAEGLVPVDETLAQRIDAVPKKLGNGLLARMLVLQTWLPREKGGPMRAFVSWWRWAEEQGVAPNGDEAAAMARLEAAATARFEAAGGRPRMPWHQRALRHRWGW